jgi:hypothetical protein
MRLQTGSVAAVLLLLLSCSSGSTPFTVVEFAQEGREDVRLNEPLLFRFSLPVDPLSVNAGCLTIRDEGGERARGRWAVSGKTVRFIPDPPEDVGLEGGGLRFGRRYSVVVAGYPTHGTVCSTRRHRIDEKSLFRFRAIGRDAATGSGSPFVDPSPGTGPLLLTVNGRSIPDRGVEIGRRGIFTMEFSEPLHPAGLHGSPIRLHRVDGDAEWAGDRTVVLLKVSFVSGKDNRKVLFLPEEPLECGGRYNLRYESLPFTDLAGNRIHDASLSFVSFNCAEEVVREKNDTSGKDE